MTNPFDLRGPEFLVFYLILGVAVNIIFKYLMLGREKQEAPAQWDSSDPYKIAFLRAGVNEVLRVVTVSLIDRGLLKASQDKIKAEKNAKHVVRKPVEKAVVEFFSDADQPNGLFLDDGSRKAAEEYRRPLESEGLIAGDARMGRRAAFFYAALLVLLGVSLVKIAVALSRGRHNILFLIILTGVFCYWAVTIRNRERTGAGDEIMRRMSERFTTLKANIARIRPGGTTNDLSFLIAVFGLTALSGAYFPYVKSLFPKAASYGGTNYSGGCGSGGCGSSGSSGCGGGCGGGGCGGCGGG